jgi:hypothetical protein
MLFLGKIYAASVSVAVAQDKLTPAESMSITLVCGSGRRASSYRLVAPAEQ